MFSIRLFRSHYTGSTVLTKTHSSLVRVGPTLTRELWIFVSILKKKMIVLRPDCIVLSLTHWRRVTHICVSKLTFIGSDNGLSPGRRQAVIWTNDGILLTGPLGTKFSEILIEIYTFSFKKMHVKMSSRRWQPFCLGLNMLTHIHIELTATYYTPRTTKLLEGRIFISLRPSVRPSRIPCPLCSAYSSAWIHFIFIHLIKLLQKVCHV